MKTVKKLMSMATLLLPLACADGIGDDDFEDRSVGNAVSHDMIVLGKQLEDPYSVTNITKAIGNLYPTKAAREDVTPTDMYVRFLPETDAQLQTLNGLGIILMDHPLDYQILKDGDYYHDPLIDDEKITWQYAVVPSNFSFPSGIRHEILDECYIPTEQTKSESELDWDAIEREAYVLTGNADLLATVTKGGTAAKPKGRITIVDDDANGGKPFGVAGVSVVCNTFVKYSTTFTDRDGYYEMDKTFTSDARYRLMFKNEKGFAIGFNLLLVPASMSALGKTSPEGIDYTITSDSDRKLFSRACVNNAVYEYIDRCSEDDLGILQPPQNLRIWLFQNLSSSSTPMLRQGCILDQGIFQKYLGEYAGLIKTFLPDITLGLKGGQSYADIYSIASHELAHASHFRKVGKTYWDSYIEYIITSFITSGGKAYGTGEEDGAGYCEIGEMWGYFMQNKLYNDRYGGNMPSAGMSYWFHPQILRYLYERGLTVSEIFKAMDSESTDLEKFKSKLLTLYPSKSSIITQVFSRYAE